MSKHNPCPDSIKHDYGGGNTEEDNNNPCAYMFNNCPITELWFDVSTCNNCSHMFYWNKELTKCTHAKFIQGGDCKGMFTQCKFDLDSAQLIYDEAKKTDTVIHIGVGVQLYENDAWVKNNKLIGYGDKDDKGDYHQWVEWVEGYYYCDSHGTNSYKCCDNATKQGNASRIIVCNP